MILNQEIKKNKAAINKCMYHFNQISNLKRCRSLLIRKIVEKRDILSMRAFLCSSCRGKDSFYQLHDHHF